MGRRSTYPEEFRQRAAQLVLDSRRSVRDVAGELGVNHETLRTWVAAERRARAAGPAASGADERLELARLRRKVAELELEPEILKKPRSSSRGRRGGEPRSGLRVHRCGEDRLRRAPSLPGASDQPDHLLLVGRPGRRTPRRPKWRRPTPCRPPETPGPSTEGSMAPAG